MRQSYIFLQPEIHHLDNFQKGPFRFRSLYPLFLGLTLKAQISPLWGRCTLLLLMLFDLTMGLGDIMAGGLAHGDDPPSEGVAYEGEVAGVS